MRRIDELHLDYPFAGSRILQGLLRGERLETGRLHIATLMKKMGIEAIYCRPNTSKPAPGHKIYPYLLRKLAVIRPNQVWAKDMTLRSGGTRIWLDLPPRGLVQPKGPVVGVSITMKAAFCIEEALARRGKSGNSICLAGFQCRKQPPCDTRQNATFAQVAQFLFGIGATFGGEF